jgi:hypothetical protein
MADLIVEGGDLVLRLTAFEKAEALHGDVRVPLTSVKSVEVLNDAIGAVHGFRVGTGIPGVVIVGTVTSADTKMFAVVHHDTRQGVRVTLEDAGFDQLVVGSGNPYEVAGRLTDAVGATPPASGPAGQEPHSGRGHAGRFLGSWLYLAVILAGMVALVLLLHEGTLRLAIVIGVVLVIVLLRFVRR